MIFVGYQLDCMVLVGGAGLTCICAGVAGLGVLPLLCGEPLPLPVDDDGG